MPDKPPPGTIPTLTEVVPWPDAPAPAASNPAPLPTAPTLASPAHAVTPAPAVPAVPAVPAPTEPAPTSLERVTEAELSQRVMADLQKQIDLMLDVRLREALAPILARAGDAIVRDARKELTTALRDVVAAAVARELGRTDKP